MSKKLGFDDFSESQHAIKEYINYKAENYYRHEARVLISSKGKTLFNDVIRVVVSIETNYSFVDLLGSESFERDFYSRYTNEYQRFEFRSGILLIQAEDRWGNDIEIDISGV